jgi:hypothetical protein
MNAKQRNIVRLACYVLSGPALLLGLRSTDIPGILGGVIGALALLVLGKVVWAGRPMTPAPGLGIDSLEAARLDARMAGRQRKPALRVVPDPGKAGAKEPASDDDDESARPIKCYQCEAENRGDAYNCAKCGTRLRTRQGS